VPIEAYSFGKSSEHLERDSLHYRLPIKIITQDAEEAKRGYGPYVTAFAGDVGEEPSTDSSYLFPCCPVVDR